MPSADSILHELSPIWPAGGDNAALGALLPDSWPLPPRPLRWLFLDLNSYFASVEQQLQPELRGRPLIVAPVGSDTTVAIAASYEAKRYGISTGTPVWEAKQKCP